MKTFKQITEKLDGGKPRGAPHIQNVSFWDKTKDSLEYIMKDASAAMKANPTARKAGKWADEVNDAATVLAFRKKKGIKEDINEERVQDITAKNMEAFTDAFFLHLGDDERESKLLNILDAISDRIEKKGKVKPTELLAVLKGTGITPRNDNLFLAALFKGMKK